MSAAQSVIETYKAMHPRSSALYERARAIIPGGVTHDGRHMKPFPVYVDRALGSHKWDVDGHEYIDYWMGHGALFLGHCHPAVVKAIQDQAARGTHLGASHELEVRWAELIGKLIPSAEMVRFAMSGTEATHLALRIARAFTGCARCHAASRFAPSFWPGRVLCPWLHRSCVQFTIWPLASRAALIFTTIAEPYGSHPNSSSRIHCTRTGRPGTLRASNAASSATSSAPL